jgi:hypothetical protein
MFQVQRKYQKGRDDGGSISILTGNWDKENTIFLETEEEGYVAQ